MTRIPRAHGCAHADPIYCGCPIPPSGRERFCAALTAGPLLKGDVVVVLCGEDADPRLAVGVQVFKSGGAPLILLSGGKHEPPRWQGAEPLTEQLLGAGIAYDRVLIESESLNTREQAVNVVSIAKKSNWKRLLIVASPYHQYRAFLTFLKALQEVNREDDIHLVMVAASHAPLFNSPAGVEKSRLDLLDDEFAKIDTYTAHVATYYDGLGYLRAWEGK